MLSSLRGSSFLYQGEELGLTEAHIPPEKRQDPGIGSTGAGRDGCRTPMPWESGKKHAGFSTANDAWLPVPDEHAAASVSAQEKDPGSVLNFARHYLKWRKQHPALLLGDIAFSGQHKDLLAFTRTHGKDSVFCAFNFSRDAVTIKLEGAPLEGHGLEYTTQGNTLTLPGFGGYFGKRAA